MEQAERIRTIAEMVFGAANPRSRDFMNYGYYLAPDIPNKKLISACETYARFDFALEQPLVLLDDTVFGNGKRGFLITTRAFHYCITNPVDGFTDYKGKLPLPAIRAFRVIGDAFYVNDAKLGTVTQPTEAVVMALERFFEQTASSAAEPGEGGPVGQAGSRSPAVSDDPARAGTREDILATIRALKLLADEGVLTAEEFADKKRELLARL